jgi:hypothetical protein
MQGCGGGPANHLKCRKSRILRPKKTCHYIEMRRVKKLFAIFCDNSQNIVTCHKSHATCRSWHAICRSSYTTRRKKLRQVATRHNILRRVATGHDWSTTQLTLGCLHTMAISLQITTMATRYCTQQQRHLQPSNCGRCFINTLPTIG